MALDFDDMKKLTREVELGIPPERSELPDTEEVRTHRAALARDIAAIKARGHAVDYPHDMPDVPVTPSRS